MQLLPVASVVGQTQGASQVAATDDTVIAVHRWLTTTSYLSVVHVFTRTNHAWALSDLIGVNGMVQDIAMADGTIAIAKGPQIQVVRRQGTQWETTATLDASTRGVQSFASRICMSGNALYTCTTRSESFPVWRSFDARVQHYSIDADGVPFLVQELEDPETADETRFGAAICADVNTLAIGAVGDDEAGPNAGAVYIYRRDQGAWVLAQKLIPQPSATSQHFGMSLALQDSRLAVGALMSYGVPGDQPTSLNFDHGRVSVYRWTGSAFELEQTLRQPGVPSTTASAFGDTVSFHGNRLVISAYRDDVAGAIDSGGIYVFDRDAIGWRFSGLLTLRQSAGGWLGYELAASTNGIFAVAPLYDNRTLALAAFDNCTLPSAGSPRLECVPSFTQLLTYVVRWLEGDITADFDGDQTIAPSDLFSFLNLWFAGCP